MGRERWTDALRSAAALAAIALAVGAACSSGGGGDGNQPVLFEGPPWDVSGSMIAAASSAIDSDTNDFFAPFASNDSAASAQEIPNPVSLGGHVNVPGAKPTDSPSGGPPPDGRTTGPGDVADWFRLSIAANQIIRLVIAEDGTTNNLDLELRSVVDESLIAESATNSRTEELTVLTTDEYYVVVVATSGFSNYNLTIGNAPTGASQLAREPEFVPGEAIVVYEDDLAPAIGTKSAAERAAGFGMRLVAGAPDGPMLFSARTVSERAKAFRALGLGDAPSHAVKSDASATDAVDATSAEETVQMVEALRSQPGVRSADLNYLRQPTATPTDALYPFQWHLDQINLPQAWDVIVDGSTEVVAVVDSGIKAGHPDFSGQLVAGYDFISNVDIANDGDGCDADPDDPGDSTSPGASSYHGTHVAGTVAARTSLGGGNSDGVAGVAWNVSVQPLRVLGVGGGTDFDIMQALLYAANRPNACGVTPGSVSRIINLSLGGPGSSQAFQDLITDLRNVEGMIFIAAAGNENSSQPSFPAAYDGVVSVSAVGPTKTRAPYSNFGSTIDVTAPGGDMTRDVDGDGPDGVMSTLYDESDGSFFYDFYQGTSMATPHVAGVVALMRSIEPAITPFDIDNALNGGDITEDLGNPTLYGAGLIDAVKAVNLAAGGDLGSTVLDPFLRVDPDGLSYGFLADVFQLSVANGGNDAAALSIVSFSFTSDDGAPWLTLAPVNVDGDGLGTYSATVDRSALADGIYTGTIEFVSTENTVNLPVLLNVGDPIDATANAGHHFVLLVDPFTFASAGQNEVDATGGQYPFAFSGIEDGSYVLIAGTDSDGDFFICDPGEACGAFPTRDTIVPLEVADDRRGLEFVTGFSGGVGTANAGESSPRRGFARD